MAVEPRVRKSADERREEILSVAVRHFAIGGLHGTSTEAIAREAGISQPYLFRLFRTKKELFLACVDRANARVRDTFQRAAAEAPEGERLKAMGHAYIDELLPDRHAVLMQMQGYVATSDPDIQGHVRTCFGRLVAEVTELSGADEASVWAFFAQGMLLNVTQSLDLEAIAGTSEWAASWCQGLPMSQQEQ
jgi:AcrR family transcriptional regulator